MFSHYTCFYSLFFFFFWATPKPTPLNFSSPSSSTSVALLFPQCFASAWPCNWKKPKSSGGGFSLPRRRWNYGWLLPTTARCKTGSQSWEVDTVFLPQVTADYPEPGWSRKDRASESNTQCCTQRCPLELVFTLTGASYTIRASCFFAVWGVSLI